MSSQVFAPQEELPFNATPELPKGAALAWAALRGEVSPDDIPEVSESEQLAANIGAYMCGDCNAELTDGQHCAHIVIDKDGNRRIIG